MIRIRDLSLRPEEHEAKLTTLAARQLRIKPSQITQLKLYKRSIDARKKPDVRVIYTVDVAVQGDESAVLRRSGCSKAAIAQDHPMVLPEAVRHPADPPVVVGFGPAGMFAALVLARSGLKPIVLERGSCVETRQEKVEAFFSGGPLDSECNVQFGEGGAGTFSDGKLGTGTHDGRIGWVLRQFADFGAGEAVTIDAKPHVGTDKLRTVVKNLREQILSLGAQVRFDTRMDGLVFENGAVRAVLTKDGPIRCSGAILALGHSARDSFRMLQAKGLPMEPKAFSMGVRIEHPQTAIDLAQYGRPRGSLPAADYKLSVHLPEGSAYSFCMCPGGYVVAAASEQGGVVTNGMSYSGRSGTNANAALLVGLNPEDFPAGDDPLRGMEWQRSIEQAAFRAGGSSYRAPAQTVGSFLGQEDPVMAVTPSYRPGVTLTDLHQILPEKVCTVLEKALPELDKKLAGFSDPGALMTAPETRSSSPVRVLRREDLQSPAARGLFPCGEGAGYAGGIVSAAVDGIRCAEALIQAINEGFLG